MIIPPALKGYLFGGLAVLLGLSLLGNLWLYSQIGDLNKAVGEAQQAQKNALSSAMQCGDSVVKLKKEADDREAEFEPLRQAAAKNAEKRNAKADRILLTPPSTPGNACKSASDFARQWLKERNE